MNGRQQYLSPRSLQALGCVLLVGSVVFWGATGRESVLMVSAAMSLIGLGAYKGAQQTLERNDDPQANGRP